MKASVIITTYNKPEYLRLALLSLVRQSQLPLEILIADDGSTEETGSLIAEFAWKFRSLVQIRHFWHEDAGFRKPAIVNRAAQEAKGDYLILTDGDCMSHRNFVRFHLLNAEPCTVLSGKRVEIGEALTQTLLREKKVLNYLHPRLIFDSIMGGGSRKVEEGIIISNRTIRHLLKKDRIGNKGVYGCNCSLHKDFFFQLNGYDEDFLYAVEDTDLGIRALNSGGRLKSVRAQAVVYHLWHKFRWVYEDDRYAKDLQLLQYRIDSGEAVCVNGIIKIAESKLTLGSTTFVHKTGLSY